MKGWTKQRVFIRIGQDPRQREEGFLEEVEGERLDGTPFAITPKVEGSWSARHVVTHVPTGREVYSFDSLTDARVFARRPARMADFDVAEPPPDEAAGPYKRAIVEAIRETEADSIRRTMGRYERQDAARATGS